MSSRQLELLQWFAFLGGPAAWAIHLVAGLEVTEASCDAGLGSFDATPAVVTLTVAAALVIALAEASAILVFRELGHEGYEAPPPDGRRRFLVTGALVGNALLFVAVVLTGVAAVAQPGCRGA